MLKQVRFGNGKITLYKHMFIFLHTNFLATGTAIPLPKTLEVSIFDGEVTVLWEEPDDAPSGATYNVQMGKYVELQYV